MSATSPPRTWWINLLLVMMSTCVALGMGEILLRVGRPTPVHRLPWAPRLCGDCPQIYELDPKQIDVSSQGFRDREFSLAAPDGAFRIAILGDSISYGLNVAPTVAFPKIFEKTIAERGARVEIINAGVPAYTAYTEWQLYLAKVRQFHPKLVLVSFCMNDVVDPSLHWQRLVSPAIARHVPEAAVPNPAYHRSHAVPLVDAWRAPLKSQIRQLLGYSEIYQRLGNYVDTTKLASVTAGARDFPAYLTGEDNLSIEVLADYDSTEWKWLRRVYDQLGDAVKADGATLGLIINPLLYQLDADYPVSVAPMFARYCEERRIPCFDLLATMRDHAAEHPFFGDTNRVMDVWHYTAAGHRIAGEALANMVHKAGLVPAQLAK